MENHLTFRKEYLPVEFTKVEKFIVITIYNLREADFSILVGETETSGLS